MYEKHFSGGGLNVKVGSIAVVVVVVSAMLSPLIHYKRIHVMKDIPCEACEIENVKICIP